MTHIILGKGQVEVFRTRHNVVILNLPLTRSYRANSSFKHRHESPNSWSYWYASLIQRRPSLITLGFIGLPTAQAFVRKGHIVYGQSRSEKADIYLRKEEIVPIVLDPATNEGVKAFVEAAKNVDVGASRVGVFRD